MPITFKQNNASFRKINPESRNKKKAQRCESIIQARFACASARGRLYFPLQ